MKRSVWVFSVLLATLFLLGHWIPGFSADSTLNTPNQPALASPFIDPLTPAERKEMETLALDFTKSYYTYSLDNYLEEGLKLLPLLTQDYQEAYSSSLEKSYIAAKAINAKSSVESALVLALEKTAPDTSIIKMQFKAKVLTHDVETLNRYSAVLELKKEDGVWLIHGITEEEPVAFSNLQGLL
ncbi:hypothetical protein Desde_1248 [Desulfitobacterium dehalogenans ATCC 51507]|uniref:DUF3828 domain-containing protein n=1 Tax=Desulfitobacterium dehalogenans (strain ATCC 51507 / DSM 9161 / JW/IU-DC1) TaxID=756499 RepID=I4A6U3_DESDJ|nr:hypothetical protein [Desulfitobacterium dehalogenans]AFL99677.1 hypothetical protein Desde_1248 [Desulfitobacterium dehalogenans ATCC 51507]